ncbi:hypothetical protein Pint_27409 [Pistacia integerrima]|uniref:Uncharacterized protein n=1 Tax=Pistacia integerrima TaxID=434235 RepID=A0ACC0YSN3_9ROSI|nr:hypothetical protein Pint_27409 [Pistacia integerrima]
MSDANQQKDRSVHRSLSENGKVLIDGNFTGDEEKSCKQCRGFLYKSGSSFKKRALKKNCTSCDSKTRLAEESSGDGNEDNSLALVPYQSNEVAMSSNSLVVHELPRSKHSWSLLRRVFSPKQQHVEKSSENKTSLIQWVLRLPSRYTSAVVYPDHKQSQSVSTDEDLNSMLDGESGAIVAFDNEAMHPLSPYHGFPKEWENLHERFPSTCRLFSYKELSLVTSDFHPDNMVGKGGHSHVYRGSLPDSKELAVKNLKPSEDVLKEFVSEIEIITSLHHKNIISLFGFCFEDNKLLLVYDFLSRGSLEESLHGNKKDAIAFGWNERYKVAVGVAEALDYLHNSCDQPVIHKDVKSSNILLSDDFEPQLSDFGLASWASTSSSHLSCTDVAGTFGFLKLLQGDEEETMWARQQGGAPEELDLIDGEAFPNNIQSHLNLALLDVDDDTLSISSTEQTVSIEDYLQGRWSRTSSFD